MIPEKCDLNSILFLLTPAETREKLELLVSHLVRFEQLLDEDALLEDVLPSVYQRYQDHYQGYTLRRLCQEMHQLSINDNIKQLQKRCSVKLTSEVKMAPQQAHLEFIRGNCELLPLDELKGVLPLKGHYRTHRAYCVSYLGKCGRGQYCVISKHQKRVLMHYRALLLSYKVCIFRKMKVRKRVYAHVLK